MDENENKKNMDISFSSVSDAGCVFDPILTNTG
jgi:hypothetical protein